MSKIADKGDCQAWEYQSLGSEIVQWEDSGDAVRVTWPWALSRLLQAARTSSGVQEVACEHT